MSTAFLLCGGLLLLISLYAASLLGNYCAARWEGDAETLRIKFMWMMGAAVCAALYFYGVSMTAIQGTFLFGVFLFSSYSDWKTHRVDDSVHCLVLAAALIGKQIYEIPMMAISAVLICGVMLLVAVISGGGIGGADMKLAGACAFLLGLQRATIGLCVGLIIAVVVNYIKQKKSGVKEAFALVPYLAVGFTLVYYIQM